MNDFDDAATPADATSSSPDVPSALAGLIDRYGPGLFYEPDRLKLLLQQECPDATREIAQVLLALSEDVPQRLLAAHGGDDLRQVMSQLVDRLSRDSLFDRTSAIRTVRTWSGALAMPTANDDATRTPPPVRSSPSVDFGFVVTPLASGSRTAAGEPFAPTVSRYGIDERPGRTPVPVKPSVIDPVDAPPAIEPVVPTNEPVVEPAQMVDVGEQASIDFEPPALAPIDVAPVEPSIAHEPSPSIVEDVPLPSPAIEAVPGTESLVEPIMAASSVPLDELMPSPAPPIDTPVEAAPPAPREAPVARDPEPVVQAALPAWARPTAPKPPLDFAKPSGPSAPRPRRRSVSIAAIVAVVVIGGLLWYRATRDDAPDVGVEEPARVEATIPPPASPPVAPIVATKDVEPVTPAVPPADTPAVVTATPDEGPGKVAIAEAPVAPVMPPPVVPAPAPAPRPAVEPRVATPPRVSAAPSIVRVDAPRIAAGKPFVVAVAITGKPSDLTGIEQRVVAGDGVREAPVTTPLSAVKVTSSGSLLVPFRSIGATTQSTVQLVLIARSGARSAPRTVAIRASDVESPLLGAPPSLTLAPCTRSTCGSVVSVSGSDANGFETILRMDDRSIQVVRQGVRWRVGSRVQRVGNRYVTIPNP